MTRFQILVLVIAALGILAIGFQLLRPRLGSLGRSDRTLTEEELARIGGRSLGPEDAPLVIVEFADFQCGACALYAQQVVERIKSDLVPEGLVRYVFADFPLPRHAHSTLAARAGHCAHELGGFWPLHDRLFAEQSSWASAEDPTNLFVGYAAEAGVPASEFESCLRSERYRQEVAESYELGREMGVSATPSLVVNGRLREDLPSAEGIRQLAVEQRGAAAGAPRGPQ